MTTFDSGPATVEHISEVRTLLWAFVDDLERRAMAHDASKLEPPEKAMFDRMTPELRKLTYGTPEYEAARQAMLDDALGHHYQHNDHHPEHFEHGIAEMNLAQIVEMLCDWKAATLRHDDGDLARSIRDNATRFGYGPEIENLLMNTARDFGWL